jgi:cytidyltransferase-like protein
MNEQSMKYREACVNGRFQPVHLGHLEYLLAAKKTCEFLWVGITRYDFFDETPCEKATHRATGASNPLTYFERTMVISAVLQAEGISKDSFAFIPFPIDQPKRLSQFLPREIPILTTVYDEWNQHKVKVLRESGYVVEVLWARVHKQYSGHSIGEAIKERS